MDVNCVEHVSTLNLYDVPLISASFESTAHTFWYIKLRIKHGTIRRW